MPWPRPSGARVAGATTERPTGLTATCWLRALGAALGEALGDGLAVADGAGRRGRPGKGRQGQRWGPAEARVLPRVVARPGQGEDVRGGRRQAVVGAHRQVGVAAVQQRVEADEERPARLVVDPDALQPVAGGVVGVEVLRPARRWRRPATGRPGIAAASSEKSDDPDVYDASIGSSRTTARALPAPRANRVPAPSGSRRRRTRPSHIDRAAPTSGSNRVRPVPRTAATTHPATAPRRQPPGRSQLAQPRMPRHQLVRVARQAVRPRLAAHGIRRHHHVDARREAGRGPQLRGVRLGLAEQAPQRPARLGRALGEVGLHPGREVLDLVGGKVAEPGPHRPHVGPDVVDLLRGPITVVSFMTALPPGRADRPSSRRTPPTSCLASRAPCAPAALMP